MPRLTPTGESSRGDQFGSGKASYRLQHLGPLGRGAHRISQFERWALILGYGLGVACSTKENRDSVFRIVVNFACHARLPPCLRLVVLLDALHFNGFGEDGRSIGVETADVLNQV